MDRKCGPSHARRRTSPIRSSPTNSIWSNQRSRYLHRPNHRRRSSGSLVTSNARYGLARPVIPVVERAIDCSAWRVVMKESCRQMKEWLDARVAPSVDRINLSALQFQDAAGVGKRHRCDSGGNRRAAAQAGLELTESVLMDASREHSAFCCDCARPGSESPSTISAPATRRSTISAVSRSIHQIAQHSCSIDRRVRRRHHQGGDALAANSSFDVIVEGVRDRQAIVRVKSCRRPRGQGYYFSKPVGPKR